MYTYDILGGFIMFFEDIFFEGSKQNVNLFDAQDGLVYGNMFKNEYVGYKDYKVQPLVANDEKSRLLLKIYELDFAINDLSLYLDIYPENMQVYKLFRAYTEEERKMIDLYEKQYGPLELNDSDYDSYMWYKGKWQIGRAHV